MRSTTTILVNTAFEGIHKYADAPNEVAFLRDPHRHIFHVCVEMEVFNDDRELEFIMVKHSLESYLQTKPFGVRSSCETMAVMICQYLLSIYGDRKMSCAVLEDNENGGKVYYEH